MKPCPNCGATDYKSVTEQKQVTYQVCANCKYSPVLEHAKPVEAKAWVLEVFAEHARLTQEAEDREQEVHDAEKPSTLQIGRMNRAKRLLASSDIKIHIAESLSEIVDDTENGQITVIIPEVGMFQFEWGDFRLFKAIDKVDRI